MAKGLCPGVGWSRGKEKRKRERPIFFRLHGKPIKPLHRTCTTNKGTGRPHKEVLKAGVGK